MKTIYLTTLLLLTGCTAYVEMGAHHAVNLAEPTVGSFEAGVRHRAEDWYLQCQYTHLSELMNGFPFNGKNTPDLLNMYGCEYGREFVIMK